MAAHTRPYERGELTEAYVEAYPRLQVFGSEVSVQQVKEQASEIEKLRQENEELREELSKRARLIRLSVCNSYLYVLRIMQVMQWISNTQYH